MKGGDINILWFRQNTEQLRGKKEVVQLYPPE
jgi:hypothetical protein